VAAVGGVKRRAARAYHKTYTVHRTMSTDARGVSHKREFAQGCIVSVNSQPPPPVWEPSNHAGSPLWRLDQRCSIRVNELLGVALSMRRMPAALVQVVSYDEGGFYSEHYDNKAGGVISRAATIIIYLDDTRQGGATAFPK
jgi:hypothetical protein